MRCLVISNPKSTSQAPQLQRRIFPALLSVTGLRSVFTTGQRHATELVRGLTRDDYDAVIAIGGDGTVNEIIHGLLGDDPGLRQPAEGLPAFAVIPTGSANVFARAMGYSRNPETATRQLVAALRMHSVGGQHTGEAGFSTATTRMTAGFVRDHSSAIRRWFAVNAGLGLDAEVIARMENLRARGFDALPQLYAPTAISAWLRMHKQPPQITAKVTSGNQTITHSGLPLALVSNTNPWTYFGAFPVVTNPDSSTDEGLSFYSIPSVSGAAGFAAVAQMISDGRGSTVGTLRRLGLQPEALRCDDAQEIELTAKQPVRFQIDGEYLGATTGLTLTAHSGVLDFLVPAAKSS